MSRILLVCFRPILTAAVFAAAILALENTAPADTYSWSGLSTTSWTDSGSWFDINTSLNGVPGGGDTALFGGSAYPLLPLLPTAQSVGGVWDTGSALATIGSSTLTINGTTINGNANTGIEMDAGAGALTISAPVTLGSAQTWLNNSSSLLTMGSINNNGFLVTYNGTGNASFGATSGSGGLTVNSTGGLNLPTRGTFTGNVVVNGGTVTCPTGNSGTSTVLGQDSGSRTVTVNPGGIISLTTNNVFFGGGTTAASLPTIVVNGGMFTSRRYNAIGNVNLISGGTLNQNASDGTGTGSYQGYDLLGTITVSGTAASYISNLQVVGTNTLGANDHLLPTSSGSTTFNVGITGASGGDLFVSAGLYNTSGDYGGTGTASGLVKTGLGNMVLQNATNAFTGATKVSAGTLTLAGGGGAGGVLSASAITVSQGAVLALNNGDVLGYTNGNALTVSGQVVKTFAQSETLNRPITLSGGTMTSTTVGAGSPNGAWNFFGGSISTASSTSNYITGVGAFSLRTPSAFFNLGASSSLTISVPITQNTGTTATPLNIQGSGALILTNNTNTYTGATVITGGTLMVGNGQSGQDGTLGSTSGVTDNSTLSFNIFGSQTFSPVISGNGRVNMIGGGIVTLSNANGYLGGTSVSNGTLQFGNATALSTGTVGVSGAVLDVNGQSASAGAITLFSGNIINSVGLGSISAAALNMRSGTVSAVVSGATPLNQTGPGQTWLTAANNYSGLTTISGGTLSLGPAATLGTGNTTIVPGGLLDVSSYGAAGYNFNSGVLAAGRTGSLGADINGNLNVNNATLSPAGAMTAGTMTINGNLLLNGASVAYDQGDLVTASALSLMGTDYVVPNSALTTGTYTVFTFGSLASGGLPNLSMGGAFGSNPRQTYSFGLSGGTAVTLTVNGLAGNLRWSGGSNSTWDAGTSQSWYNLSTSGADYFFTGDNTTFNDTPGTATVVTINGAVQPGTLTVSNTNVNYTFSGPGSIVGTTSLVMNGLGMLTLGTSNSYAGGTHLSSGTLNANAASALGTGAVSVNGGLLNINAAQPVSSVSMSAGVLNDGAAGSLGGGPLVVSGGTANVANGQSISSATFSAGLLTVGNSASLGSGLLTISGGTMNNTSGGALTLSNSAQNWNGSFAFLGSNPLNLGAGPVTIGAPTNVFVGGNSLTVGGVVNGAALTKSGPGALILTNGNDSYASTSLLGGVLSFTSGALGSGPVSLSGGTLQYATGNTQDISSQLTLTSGTSYINTNGNNVNFGTAISGGSGALDKTGSGNLTLNGNNNFTGGTTVNSGTLTLNTGGASGTLQGPLTINPGATVLTAVNNAIGYSGTYWVRNITINGGVLTTAVATDNGWGTTINMTAGTMNTTVSGGYFAMGNGPVFNITGTNVSSLISSSLTARDGTNGIVYNVTRGSAAADLVISGNIINSAGGAGITLNGNGIMVLSGSSNYNGATTVNGGTLAIGSGGSTGSIGFSSGVVDNGTFVVNLGSVAAQGTTLPTGIISGSGSLVQLGSGSLTLTSNNTYSGGTTIANGVLNAATIVPVGGASNIGNATTPIVLGNSAGAAGTLNYTGSSATFAPGLTLAAGGGTVSIANAGQALTFGGATGSGPLTIGGAGNATFSGAISGGPVSFTTNTTGVVTLAGSNTFGGPTTVNAGSLYLNGANATTSISVANGATLGGTGSASSAVVNVADGATLDFSQNTGSTFATAGLAFNNVGNGITLNVNDANGIYSSKPAVSAGTLTTGFGPTPISVNVNNVPTGSGQAEILQYSGSIGGGGFGQFVLSSPSDQGRAVYNLVNVPTAGGGFIDLAYTVDYLHWTGAVSVANGWDTTTPNWVLNSNGGTATYQDNTDIVVFDDRAGPNGTVNMASVLYPASVTFSNTATSYVLQGAGGIQGTTAVTINGAGSVTLATLNNGYNGGTFVLSGTLNDGAAGSLGQGPLAVSGGAVNLVNSQSVSNVTLAGGLLNVANSLALGSGTLAISGGTLDNTSGQPMTLANSNPIAVSGNFTYLGSSNPLNTSTGPVTISNSPTLNVSASTLTVAGPISGFGGMTKSGSGTLVLLGANSYSGTTAVTGGGLVGNTATLPGPINLANNASVTLSQSTNGTWGQTISGNGSLTLQGGATVIVSSPQSYSGRTVVAAGTTLQLPQPSIGIKFSTGQGGTSYPVTGAAGALAMANWNNVTGFTQATPQTLVNQYNGSSPVTATWSGNNAYSVSTANQTDQNAQLLNAYIDTSATIPNSIVTLSGIPYSSYNIYVYFGSDGNGRTGSMGVSGGTVTYDYSTDANIATLPYPLIQTTDTTGANPAANYCEFTNLSGSVQTISSSRGSNNNGIAAVEIVPVSVQASALIGQVLPAATQVQLAAGATFDMAGDNQTVGSLADLVSGAGGSLVTTSLGIPVTLTLAPSGGVAAFSGVVQNGGGTLSLVMNGPGLQILTGSNTYTGATTISSGTLQLGNGSPGADGSLSTSAVTVNSALAYNLAGSQTVSYPISGSGSLTKLGSGTLVMGVGGGYSGATTVAGGKLYLSGANATTSISVAGGATLGGNASAPAATASVANTGTLDIGSGGFGSLALAGLTFNNTAVVKIYNPYQYLAGAAIVTTASNGLTVNGGTGSVVFNLAGAAPGGSGIIPLMQYSGAIQGASGFSAFGLNTSGLVGRSGTYSLTSQAGFVDLSYTVDSPVWSGTVNNVWDTNSTPNWVLAVSGSATTFHVNDSVVFNDSAGTNNVVNISTGNVSPSAVTFSNSNVAYTLQGNYGIVGAAALAVNGGGSVTIANGNNYTVGTSVSNGSTLNLAAAQAIGTGPLTVSSGTVNANYAQSPSSVVVNGGLLNLNAAQASGTGSITVYGGTVNANSPQSPSSVALNGGLVSFASGGLGTAPVSFSGGTLAWQAGNTQDISSQINIANPGQIAYLNPNGNVVPIASAISGSGGLEEVGGGTLTLNTAATYTGGTTINTGVLAINNTLNNGTGMLVGTLTINAGGLVEIGAHDVFGYSGSNVSLNTLNINGGTLDRFAPGSTNETLTGVVVNMKGGLWSTSDSGDFDMFYNGYGSASDAVNVLPSNSTAVISANLNFRSVSPLFTVGSGTTSSGIDLLVSGSLFGPNGLIKAGPGEMVLSGSNTYTGGTNVLAGILVIDSPSSLAGGSNLTVGQSASSLFAGPAFATPSSDIAAVPEPGTVGLLAAGLIAGYLLARRKRG
jgi:fibronectin-binding autotransporter adhesin